MFSTFLNVIKTPSQRTSLECDDTPKSPLSQAIHGLDSLHLTDDLSIPGSFSPGLSMVSIKPPVFLHSFLHPKYE